MPYYFVSWALYQIRQLLQAEHNKGFAADMAVGRTFDSAADMAVVHTSDSAADMVAVHTSDSAADMAAAHISDFAVHMAAAHSSGSVHMLDFVHTALPCSTSLK